jgi:hypothetical protein
VTDEGADELMMAVPGARAPGARQGATQKKSRGEIEDKVKQSLFLIHPRRVYL